MIINYLVYRVAEIFSRPKGVREEAVRDRLTTLLGVCLADINVALDSVGFPKAAGRFPSLFGSDVMDAVGVVESAVQDYLRVADGVGYDQIRSELPGQVARKIVAAW